MRLITSLSSLTVLLMLIVFTGCSTPQTNAIPGTLIITGGGRISDESILEIDRLLRTDAAHASIVVIPTASIYADDATYAEEAIARFQGRGFAQVDVLHTRDRDVAEQDQFSQALLQAHGIWMPGGAQDRLTAPYLDTLPHQRMRELLNRGGTIGGTSAGAAVMSEIMIAGGNPEPELARGFGFLPGYIVDQHFTQRSRMPRLINALKKHPDLIGMGIDESTSVIVRGNALRVIGPGNVYLVTYDPMSHEESIDVLSAGDVRVLGQRP